MAGLCIPKSIVLKLKSAIKSGELPIDKLYNMTDTERNTVFEHYVGKDSASLVNAVYEKAQLVAEKKAAADYVTASDKSSFTQKATAGEFGKKLLTDAQTKKFAVDKLDARIKTLEDRHAAVTEKSKGLIGEDKANSDLKLAKLKDQVDQLNVRKENIINPAPDRMLARIQENKGLLGNEDYNDLAKMKTGLDVTPAEGKYITDKATQLQELAKGNGDAQFGITPEYQVARDSLDTYINSLNQKSALRSIGNSLASLYKNLFIGLKTGSKTAALGTLNGTVEFFNRRNPLATGGKVFGDVPISEKAAAVFGNIKFFAKTRENTFLKTSLDDSSVFGKSSSGYAENFGAKDQNIRPSVLKPVAQGANLAARAVRFVTIDVLHKVPMLGNMSVSFVDAADITSSQLAKTPLAKSLGMDATAIFKDALKIEPKTPLGQIARMRSQQEAFRILNINNTPLSDAATALQKSFNNAVPGLHMGDYALPMAKVPSSVIYNEIENFGLGLGTGLKDVIQGTNELRSLKQSGNESSAEGVQATMKTRDGIKTLTRTIGTIAVAAYIVHNLTKKDVTSDIYGDTYIRMGNLWLSTEVFGQAGAAVSGMALARTGNTGFIEDYSKGGVFSLIRAPAVSDVNSIAQSGMKSGVSGIVSGIGSSLINPIVAQDVEKSVAQQNITPIFVGSLIRTEAQVKQQDKASALKRAQKSKATAAQKNKPQTVF